MAVAFLLGLAREEVDEPIQGLLKDALILLGGLPLPVGFAAFGNCGHRGQSDQAEEQQDDCDGAATHGI